MTAPKQRLFFIVLCCLPDMVEVRDTGGQKGANEMLSRRGSAVPDSNPGKVSSTEHMGSLKMLLQICRGGSAPGWENNPQQVSGKLSSEGMFSIRIDIKGPLWHCAWWESPSDERAMPEVSLVVSTETQSKLQRRRSESPQHVLSESENEHPQKNFQPSQALLNSLAHQNACLNMSKAKQRIFKSF